MSHISRYKCITCDLQLWSGDHAGAAANGFTDFSACKFYHNSTAIHKTVMSLYQHMCFWTFFVNKFYLLLQKWIFNILTFLCEHQLEVRDSLLQ